MRLRSLCFLRVWSGICAPLQRLLCAAAPFALLSWTTTCLFANDAWWLQDEGLTLLKITSSGLYKCHEPWDGCNRASRHETRRKKLQSSWRSFINERLWPEEVERRIESINKPSAVYVAHLPLLTSGTAHLIIWCLAMQGHLRGSSWLVSLVLIRIEQ